MADHEDMNDDERLSAYLDGELAQVEAAELERQLAARPALAQRLAQLRTADRSARRAWRAIDEIPMPAAVLELLGERDAGRTGDRPAARVIPMPVRGPRRFLQMPVAIAASVALVAGFLVHDLVDRNPALELSGTVGRNADLYRLLETGVSGAPTTLSGGDGRIVLTFRSGEGDWCRQFHLRADGGETQGLACRHAGEWQLDTASFAGPGTADGPYRQAAGATPVALEAAVRRRLGSGEPLEPDEEKQIISNGWESPR